MHRKQWGIFFAIFGLGALAIYGYRLNLPGLVTVGVYIHAIDAAVSHFFQMIQSPFLTKVFMTVTSLATVANLAIVSCVVVVYFVCRKRWYYAILLPVSLSVGIFLDVIFKQIVHVPRPAFSLIHTSDFSFPSGHATVAVIFFGLIAYFFKDSIRSNFWRGFYVSVCVLFAVIICISRLYLNVHWLSDVLAGVAFGTFWVMIFVSFLPAVRRAYVLRRV